MAEGRRTLDVSYREAVPPDTRGHLLDIFEPSGQAPPAGWPVLIWSSGSAWLRDDGKRGADHIAEIFNPLGYIVVGLSIRSSSQVRFPGQLHDIRAAIRWLRTHAPDYSLDSERIAIMGNSSGGWVAAMAAVTGSIPRVDGEPDPGGVSSAVQAAVSFFPPVDFLAMDRHTLEQKATYDLDYLPTLLHDDATSPESRLAGGPVQEHPDSARAANPVSHVDGTEPPIMILHGTADPLLPPGGSRSLYEAIASNSGQATLVLVDGAGHVVDAMMTAGRDLPGGPIIGAATADWSTATEPGFTATTSPAGAGPGPTWADIGAFLATALQPPERPPSAAPT